MCGLPTVSICHARYNSRNRTSSIWMGHAATLALCKAELLKLDNRQSSDILRPVRADRLWPTAKEAVKDKLAQSR